MAFIGPLDDRVAIRELHGAYADCAFREDKARFLACWCEGGHWCFARRTCAVLIAENT